MDDFENNKRIDEIKKQLKDESWSSNFDETKSQDVQSEDIQSQEPGDQSLPQNEKSQEETYKQENFQNFPKLSNTNKIFRIGRIVIIALIIVFIGYLLIIKPRTDNSVNKKPQEKSSSTNVTPSTNNSNILIVTPGTQNQPEQKETVISNEHQGNSNIELGPEISIPMMDLKYVPDGHISKIENNGQITLFVSALDRSYTMTGNSLDNLKLVTGSNNEPVSIFQPSPNLTYEKDYAALASIVYNKYNGDLIGIYHTEVRANKDASNTQSVSIAVAISKDNGKTWTKKGQIITGPTNLPVGTEVSGAGQPSAVFFGDYIYLYYSEWDGQHTDAIHLARALVKSDGLPGSWTKYTKTGFNSPGLGGKSDPVILPPKKNIVYTSNPSVSYNDYYKKLLAIYETNIGFFASVSTDGISWTSAQQFFTFPKDTTIQKVNGDIWYSYPSYISSGTPTDMETGKGGYLYYSRGIFGQYHLMVKRSFNLK